MTIASLILLLYWFRFLLQDKQTNKQTDRYLFTSFRSKRYLFRWNTNLEPFIHWEIALLLWYIFSKALRQCTLYKYSSHSGAKATNTITYPTKNAYSDDIVWTSAHKNILHLLVRIATTGRDGFPRQWWWPVANNQPMPGFLPQQPPPWPEDALGRLETQICPHLTLAWVDRTLNVIIWQTHIPFDPIQ